MKKAIFILLASALFLPAVAFADVSTGLGPNTNNCVPVDFTGPLAPGQQYCETVTLFGIDLGCYAELPPNQGGCGIEEFMNFLRKLVNFLTLLIVPLAALVIIWGGIVILASGGSEERVRQGRKIILAAIVGVAIALGSWLIINSIYLALTGRGAEETIQNVQRQ